MSRTVLVTGANKGIGFAIVQLLATRSPEDHVLLAVRDVSKGEDAIARLRQLGVTSQLDIVHMDVTSDESVLAAEKEVRSKHKKLDVLINNAALAIYPETPLSSLRTTYTSVLNTNVTSPILVTESFLPLLKSTSADPRVIQVSSTRGSLSATANEKLPPPVAVSYPASKAALNLATLLLAQREGNRGVVVFQCSSPGHCRTDFNGNSGKKEPIEGARVAVELVLEDKEGARARECGIWEIEGGREMERAEW